MNKEKLINSIEERIKYFESELTEENKIKIKELKELLHVINKGCFDK